MFEKIKERLFPFFIALSALSVSLSAAFYSVSGLSKLFAGASFEVTVMASSLEISKLVIASLLYQYRKTLPKLLKYYLTTACLVLIFITSMGIYGFLSSAYQVTASKAGNVESQISLIEVKRDNISKQLLTYNVEKENIDKAIADLRKGLSNNVIQYKDKETGKIITTTSSSTRKSLEKQLNQAMSRQEEITSKVDELNEKIFNYESEIVEIKTSDNLAAELGPLKYISGLTGLDMDKVINYLLLVIVFVFDPLAIALVVAANYAFEKLKEKYTTNLYGEKVEKKEKSIYNSDGVISGSRIITKPTSKSKPKFNPQEWEIKDFIGEKSTPPTQEEIIPPTDIDPNLSSWRKNKLKKENGDNNLTKTY